MGIPHGGRDAEGCTHIGCLHTQSSRRNQGCPGYGTLHLSGPGWEEQGGHKNTVEAKFDYDLNFTCDGIRDTYQWDATCQGTVPQAIRAFLDGTDFEDCIRTAISLGGDSDTLACITGSIAEAFYGIPLPCMLRPCTTCRRISSRLWRNLKKNMGRKFTKIHPIKNASAFKTKRLYVLPKTQVRFK